ncbi:MAG TPA: hypothetical protein VJT83_00155, partial [Chitinophagaceae bacterium]|nr:hypothetical protein [Chitinophagaceae bacterium]
MKRLIFLLFVSLIVKASAFAQIADTIVTRIVLIGDAGALVNGQQAVVQAIKKNVPLDKRTSIVYLGDNIYKIGLPDDAYVGYNEAKQVLDSQVAIFKNTEA